MEILLLFAILAIGLGAGLLGSLFGIGGGLFIVPALTLLFGLSPTEAAAASLVGIVATSVGGTVYYLDKGVTNIRLGLLLEISTVIGAVIGAAVSGYLEEWLIMSIFTAVIVISGIRMILNRSADVPGKDDGEFVMHDIRTGEDVRYDIENVPGGFALCSVAGVISSLTGVGGGVIKVPIMNMMMGVPIKAATATSSYMIGITAFSGALIYFLNGQVLLDVAAFVAVGTFIGAVAGSRISRVFDGSSMKKYFSLIVFVIAALMILRIGGIL